MSDNPRGKETICRIVIQQCTKATLRFDTEDSPVEIRHGMVVFTCFLQGAQESHLDAIVKGVLNAKLCEPKDVTGDGGRGGGRDTAFKEKVDVLVIPQATLGGKLKGKSVQYHGLVDKTLGEELFTMFVEKIKKAVEKNEGELDEKVKSGVYGARQILSMETNGPFTHVFDF